MVSIPLVLLPRHQYSRICVYMLTINKKRAKGYRSFRKLNHLSFQFANRLRSLYEFRFQLHRPDTIDLAVDIMIANDQADIFDLCSDLDY